MGYTKYTLIIFKEVFIMLFNIKQCILVEEGLANLWQFAKSVTVSTLQSLPLYSNEIMM